MDAEHERVNTNDPLRALFQDAGHVVAPSGLEDRILVQLERPALRPTPALITPRTGLWISAVTLLIIALFIQHASVPSMSFASRETLHLPDFMGLLTNRWGMATMAGILALLAMDRLVQWRVRRNLFV